MMRKCILCESGQDRRVDPFAAFTVSGRPDYLAHRTCAEKFAAWAEDEQRKSGEPVSCPVPTTLQGMRPGAHAPNLSAMATLDAAWERKQQQA
jgi:hypothetical protein